MLVTVLRRACLWIENKGQCTKKLLVDSTSRRQEQRGFKESWKLCLSLCSRKWLRSRQSLLANLISFELSWLTKLFAVGLIKFKIPFLKTGKLLLMWKLGFSLFDSITDERRNEFLKKFMFKFEKRDFHYCHKELYLLFCNSRKTSSALT